MEDDIVKFFCECNDEFPPICPAALTKLLKHDTQCRCNSNLFRNDIKTSEILNYRLLVRYKTLTRMCLMQKWRTERLRLQIENKSLKAAHKKCDDASMIIKSLKAKLEALEKELTRCKCQDWKGKLQEEIQKSEEQPLISEENFKNVENEISVLKNTREKSSTDYDESFIDSEQLKDDFQQLINQDKETHNVNASSKIENDLISEAINIDKHAVELENTRLRSELEKSKNDLETCQSLNKQLEKKFEHIEKEYQDRKTVTEISKENLTTSRIRLSEEEMQLETMKLSLADLRVEKVSLSDKLDRSKSEIETLQKSPLNSEENQLISVKVKELEKVNASLSELEIPKNGLEARHSMNEHLERKLQLLNEEYDGSKAEIKILKEDLKTSRMRLSEEEAQVNTLKLSLADSRIENASLAEELNRLRIEIETLQKKLVSEENQLMAAKAELVGFNTLEDELNKCRQHRDELLSKSDTVKKQMETLKEDGKRVSDELDDVKPEIYVLIKEKEELNSRIKTMEMELKDLKSEEEKKKELEKVNEEFKKILMDSKAECDELKKEIDYLKTNFNAVKMETDLKDALQEELNASKNTLVSLRKTIEVLEVENSELKKKFEEAKKEVDKGNRESYNTVKVEASLKEAAHQDLNALGDAAQTEVDVLKDKLASLMESIEKRNTEHDQLKEELEYARKEVDQVKLELNLNKMKMEADLKVAEQELDVLKKAASEEHDALKNAAQMKLDALKEAAREEVDALKTELDNLRKSITMRDVENGKLQEELDTLKATLGNLRDSIEVKNIENGHLQEEFERAKIEADQVKRKSDLDKIKEEAILKDAQQELHALKNTLPGLRESIEVRDVENGKMKEELGTLKNTLADLRKDIEMCDTENDKLKKELEQAKSDVEKEKKLQLNFDTVKIDLERRLKNSETEFDELKEELENLRLDFDKVKEKAALKDATQEELDTLKNTLADLRDIIEKRDIENDKLKKELDQTKKHIGKIKQESNIDMTREKALKTAVQEELDALKDTLLNLRKNIEERDAENEKLQKEFDQAKKEVGKSKLESNEMQNKNNQLDDVIKMLNNEITHLNNKINQLMNEKNQLDKTIGRKSLEVKQMTEKLESMSSERDSLKVDVEKIRSDEQAKSKMDKVKLQENLAIIEKENDVLMDEAQKEIDALKLTLSNLQEVIDMRNIENDELKKELEAAKTKINEVKKESSEIQNKNKNLDAVIKNLNNEVTRLDNEVVQLNSQKGQLEKNIERKSSEVEQMKERLKSLSLERDSLKVDAEKMQFDRDKLSQELDEKVRRMSDVSKGADKWMAEAEKLKMENNIIRKGLDELQKDSVDMKADIKDEIKIEKVSAGLSNSRQELEQARKENDELKINWEKSKRDLDKCMRENEKLKSELGGIMKSVSETKEGIQSASIIKSRNENDGSKELLQSKNSEMLKMEIEQLQKKNNTLENSLENFENLLITYKTENDILKSGIDESSKLNEVLGEMESLRAEVKDLKEENKKLSNNRKSVEKDVDIIHADNRDIKLPRVSSQKDVNLSEKIQSKELEKCKDEIKQLKNELDLIKLENNILKSNEDDNSKENKLLYELNKWRKNSERLASENDRLKSSIVGATSISENILGSEIDETLNLDESFNKKKLSKERNGSLKEENGKLINDKEIEKNKNIINGDTRDIGLPREGLQKDVSLIKKMQLEDLGKCQDENKRLKNDLDAIKFQNDILKSNEDDISKINKLLYELDKWKENSDRLEDENKRLKDRIDSTEDVVHIDRPSNDLIKAIDFISLQMKRQTSGIIRIRENMNDLKKKVWQDLPERLRSDEESVFDSPSPWLRNIFQQSKNLSTNVISVEKELVDLGKVWKSCWEENQKLRKLVEDLSTANVLNTTKLPRENIEGVFDPETWLKSLTMTQLADLRERICGTTSNLVCEDDRFDIFQQPDEFSISRGDHDCLERNYNMFNKRIAVLQRQIAEKQTRAETEVMKLRTAQKLEWAEFMKISGLMNQEEYRNFTLSRIMEESPCLVNKCKAKCAENIKFIPVINCKKK